MVKKSIESKFPDMKIKFKYIFPKEYNPIFVTGMYGGVIPSGEIVVNFFLERHGLPISSTQAINDNGTLGVELEIEPADNQKSFVRYVQNGVILSLSGAKALQAWLTDKITEAENIEKMKKG